MRPGVSTERNLFRGLRKKTRSFYSTPSWLRYSECVRLNSRLGIFRNWCEDGWPYVIKHPGEDKQIEFSEPLDVGDPKQWSIVLCFQRWALLGLSQWLARRAPPESITVTWQLT